MNNIIIHNYLNQLRVISLFNEGEKARLENGFLTVDNKNLFNWIKRQKWLFPWSLDIDSKEETVKYLQNFYISISQSIDQIILEINNTKDKNKYERLLITTVSLLEKLTLSIKGLINLSNTYKNYPKQYSEIHGIIDDYIKPSLQILYKNIPKNELNNLQLINIQMKNDIFKDQNLILQNNFNSGQSSLGRIISILPVCFDYSNNRKLFRRVRPHINHFTRRPKI
jgi:hypothetical protein